jgi:hypothetical protein
MTIAAEVSKTTRDFVGTTRHLLIDGKWVEAVSGKTFVTTDPATGEEITRVAYGEAEDIDRAGVTALRGTRYLRRRRDGYRRTGQEDQGCPGLRPRLADGPADLR